MKKTKRSLFLSITAMILCCALLAGTTFAWFTDSASTGVNTIVAGNLDIEVDYSKDGTDWKTIERTDSLFSNNLWEPGHTEYVYLRVKNAGTLALKYKVLVTPVSENGGISMKDGSSFKLSDYLVFGTSAPNATPTTHADRNAARAAVAGNSRGLRVNDLTQTGTMVGKTATSTPDPQYLALVVYMPEEVGNEANYKTGTAAPTIELGIKVIATQLENESDSFGNDYDAGAGQDPNYSASVIPSYNYAPQVNLTGMLVLNQDGTQNTTNGAEASVGDNDQVTHYTITSTSTVPGTTTPDAKVTIPKDAINWTSGEGDTQSANVQVNVRQDTTYNPSTSGITIQSDEVSKTMDIKVTGLANGNTEVLTAEVFYGKHLTGVALYHNSTKMTEKGTKEGVTGADEFHYDPTSGMVTLGFTSCSPFTAVYKDVGVAAIGEKFYPTLQDAVDAAENGNTIYLLKDVVLTETLSFAKEYAYNKFVTIDMNGKSVIGAGVRAIHVKGGSLKLDGTGTVSSTVANVGSSVIRVGDNAATATSYLYVQKGVTVSTDTAYGITAFGSKSETVNVYGTVISNAPANEAYDGCAISTVGTDTTFTYINIYEGATVSAANTNAIYMPSGKLTVNGGTITGRTGIYVKSGDTTIKGGTITGNGPAVAYGYYGNGGISTGDALVVDSCGYPRGVPTVTVNGGTFTSTNAKAVASYCTEGNELVQKFIKKGTFSSEPDVENLEANAGKLSGNGVWTVHQHDKGIKNADDAHKASDATCTEKAKYYYTCSICGGTSTSTFTDGETLGGHKVSENDNYCEQCGTTFDILKIANDGKVTTATSLGNLTTGTYKLFADITHGRGAVGNNGSTNLNVTLDLNGHTLTVNNTSFMGFYFLRCSNSTLTVKNGTINEIASAGGALFGFVSDNGGNKLILDESLTINCYGENTSAVLVEGANNTLETAATITCKDAAIMTNGSTTKASSGITVTGGSITSDTVAIYLPAGQLTVRGGTITGDTAVYAKANVNITGGTLHGTGEKQDYVFNGSGCNSTGDALVIDSCNYPGGAPVVSVTGGTFTSDHSAAVGSYAGNGVKDPVTGFITGGTFSSDPSAYVGTGHQATSGNNTWTVQ